MSDLEYDIDFTLLAHARAQAAESIAKAARLRQELADVDGVCLRWHTAIHEIVTKGRGSVSDHRIADAGLPWNFDAMRAARKAGADS